MKKTNIDLVPNTENKSPDYYCTWQSQLYACSNAGPQGQRDHMTEQDVFGCGDEENDIKNGIGWATHQYKEAREDLYLILDDSWDVPANNEAENDKWYGSLFLARDKFPNAYGLDAAEAFSLSAPIDANAAEQAMCNVAERVKKLGWRGLGGWVCVGKAPALMNENDMTDEQYWTDALLRAYRAGWRYWKMDWGKDSGKAEIRQLVTELSHKLTPEMWIEHAIVPEVIPTSDTFRSYDAFTLMAIPLTLQRLAELLMNETQSGYGGLINCEDEPYIAAALGCVLGVMRHGMAGNLPNGEPDCSFPALHRNFKTKLTEVLRTVRWHRIAPAYGVSGKETFVDKEKLFDTWNIVSQKHEIEAWWKYCDGDKIEGSAPARIARGLVPPVVIPDESGCVPYVIASKNPSGAVSIATLGRTENRRYFLPKCLVTLEIDDADTIGVFGNYEYLTLVCTYEIKQIYMQDLAGDFAYDITADCKIEKNQITISGDIIEKIGCSCNPDGDTSEAGVIIKLIK